MPVKGKFRDRNDVEVAVLEALVDRNDEGMTVFELRSRVDADIDDIEAALASLKADDLITVEENTRAGDRAVIKPADRVTPVRDADHRQSLLERLREQLPF